MTAEFIRITEIENRLAQVTREPTKLQQEKDPDGWTRCPMCDCPMCDTESDVELRTFWYDEYAAGVQVFGIGEDLEKFENFIEHAREDMKWLIDRVHDLEREVRYYEKPPLSFLD